jgi:hypothetical protein
MATTRGSSKLGLILQLEALAIHHEQLAAAIRTTLSLVRSEAKVPKEDAGSLLSQALEVDVARRGGRRELPTNGNGAHGPAIVVQRQKTADKLAQFDRSEPRRVPGLNNAGVLIANGYLLKKPGGFVRTDKPFVVDRSAAPAAPAEKSVKHAKKKGYWDKAATVARRKKTAAVLATYDTKKAKPLIHKAGLGALIAAGYLRHQGDGYVRTAKVFEP